MSAANPKVTLIVLFALFIVPLVAAWLMYSGVIDFRPGETSNRGDLVQPPVPAQWPDGANSLNLARHWVLVYPVSFSCAAPCRNTLTGLRQVKRALGRDGDRLRIVALNAQESSKTLVESIGAIDPGIMIVEGAATLEQQLEAIADGTGTYLVDPLGNVMMHYPPDFDANLIRLDLDHLLKYGKTDPQ